MPQFQRSPQPRREDTRQDCYRMIAPRKRLWCFHDTTLATRIKHRANKGLTVSFALSPSQITHTSPAPAILK
jgi:hypothetical protein